MRYRHIKHPSKLATLAITFGAGNRVEFNSKYPYGIAHFTEHMVFKGTDNYTAKELAKKTAKAGGSWNAWTSRDLVSYYMTIPEENIETAFQCLSDIVQHPTFPPEEIAKEKDVVVQEINMYNDDIDTLVDYRTYDMIFNNSLSKPVLGTEESVRSITQQNLLDFHKKFYGKDNMLLTLGSSHQHSDLVEKYFGVPDDKLVYQNPDQNIEYSNSEDDVVRKQGQIQNHIQMCFGGDTIKKLNDQREKVKVFSVIFGASDTSRLWMRIREDLGLTYGISSGLCNHMNGNLYFINTSTEPKNTETMVLEINSEIDKMRNTLPTQEELDTAKNTIKSSVYKALDSSTSTSIQHIYKEYFGYDIGDDFIRKVDEVSLQDIQDIANIIFNENKYVVIGTGANAETQT